MNLRKLHDAITDDVIANLHYFDNVENISEMRTAKEVTDAMTEGVHRYQNEPIFRAKVKTMVSAIMRSVSDAARNDVQEKP